VIVIILIILIYFPMILSKPPIGSLAPLMYN